MAQLRRAVFLDRDGVINRRPAEGEYIFSVSDFELLSGVGTAIAHLQSVGYLVFVVTNQRCISRGIVSAQTVLEIHDHMQRLIRKLGGYIDHIYVCPHDYADACDCRKPRPGMLLQTANEYFLDLSRCWMIGDSSTDISAGRAAGCRTILMGRENYQPADHVGASLQAGVEHILKHS